MNRVRLNGIFTMIVLLCIGGAYGSDKQFNVLVFTKTQGFHHKSVVEAIGGIRGLAKQHHFDMQWHEDANVFTDENLKQFDVVMFLLTTGDILNKDQQAAFERFIQSGKGFVGVHSASDTEYDWPWFGKLVGRNFHIHPTIQTATLNVIDRSFPGLSYFPDSSLFTDEWYEFGPELSPNLNYILSIDESSYNPVADWGTVKGDGMGDFHPIAWYQHVHNGRSFYTGLGHLPAVYKNTAYLQHLYAGLYWSATGKGITKK